MNPSIRGREVVQAVASHAVEVAGVVPRRGEAGRRQPGAGQVRRQAAGSRSLWWNPPRNGRGRDR